MRDRPLIILVVAATLVLLGCIGVASYREAHPAPGPPPLPIVSTS